MSRESQSCAPPRRVRTSIPPYVITLGTKQGNTITTEPLMRPFGPDKTDALVGDAVARIAGSTIWATDYFDASDTLRAQYDASGSAISAFPQSFTDYQVLPETALEGGFVPVPWRMSAVDSVLQHLADRWSRSVGWNGTRGAPTPSHQLLIIGDTDGSSPLAAVGQTTKTMPGEIASFTFRGAIDTVVTQSGVHNGQNPGNWAIWKPNPAIQAPKLSRTI